MTLKVESPLPFIFHSSWSKCALAHSWGKLRVQERTVKANSWLVATSSFSEAWSPLYTQYTTQPFHNTWTGLIFSGPPFFLPVHALTMWRTFQMLSVFLSAFDRVSIELHGKLFSCLITHWISLAHSLICTGGILHWETPVIGLNWLERLRLEVQYKAYWEMQFSSSAESSHFLSAVATFVSGCSLE